MHRSNDKLVQAYRNRAGMTQGSTVLQNYNLSLVSGGKPILPRTINPSLVKKNISCLTSDGKNFIVPFNNQIKIYSVETRKCVKTLKFSNNELLSTIFIKNLNENIIITDILLGDITLANNEDKDQDNLITIVTNKGHIIILNYKGKLIESPKFLQLYNSNNDNESIFKVFSHNKLFKILTIIEKGNDFIYNLYNLSFNDITVDPITKINKIDLNSNLLSFSLKNVILANWSNDEMTLALLYNNKKTNSKFIKITSTFDDAVPFNFEIPLNSVFSEKILNSQQPSTINRFVSSLAIDNGRSQLALGFASGVITIVSLTNQDGLTTMENNDLQIRLLKWHIDSVLSLCFNNDGSYLLSGGWEKVLSFWQLSTNMQQFLPRLNGIIIDSQITGNNGKYYSIALQMSENSTNSDYQLILLNSADLTSKLSICGPLPIFNTEIPNTIHPISTMNLNSSSLNSIKRYKKKLLKSKKNDFTSCIELNPVTKQLYIPHGTTLQTFDFYKNEQIDLQYLSDGIQNHMGKVRNELNIQDPEIRNLKITSNGQWLISYEVDFPPQDLLSSNDLVHILKFWSKKINADGSTSWELKTKVLNPHGIESPIISMSCSSSTNNGNNILTADNNGGLKYWEFDNKENNWCLRKILLPNFNNFSNSVSLAWSRDNSLIFHGFDDKLQLIDFESFKKIDDDIFNNGGSGDFTMDSEIKAINLVGESNLIIATTTSLIVLDLLLGKFSNAYDLYPYVNGNYKNGHFERLISCDETNGKIAIAINEQTNSKTLEYKSHILIFNSNLSVKLGEFINDQYISWIGWNHDTDFIFIDTSSRLGIVGTTVNTEMADEINKESILDGLASNSTVSTSANDSVNNDYLDQLRKLAVSRNNINLKSVTGTQQQGTEDNDEIDLEMLTGEHSNKMINMSSFSNLFENIQNNSMETLFDSVVKILN